MNTRDLRIGITGSDGFIGRHLTATLTEQGYTVYPFTGSLLNPADITAFFTAHPVTTVIHLLGTSRPPLAHMLEKNVLMTQQLLETGIPLGLRRLVFTSTGIVYGEGEEGRLFRETDVPQPTSDYGLTKLFAEQCIERFRRTHGVSYAILRCSNVYGPGHYRGALYDLLTSIREHGTVTITGDGTQRRNFIHVADVCRAVLAVLPHEPSATFNIGHPAPSTLNDVVALLRQHYTFTVTNAPVDTTKPRGSGMDVTKAQDVLGFTAEKTIAAFLSGLSG